MPTLHDLRLALRTLRSAPTFTLTAVLSLALGIGGATAMLAAVDVALLRPLPWPESHRLVAIEGRDADGGVARVSLADVRDWQAVDGPLTAVAGYRPRSFAVRADGDDRPRVVDVGMATAELLGVLGVEPLHGRGFSSGEDRRDEAVVVLDQALARSLAGSAAAAVGTRLLLNDVPHTVVGVVDDRDMLPMDGRLPAALIPISDERYGGSRTVRALWAVGRLADGASRHRAAAALDAHADRIARDRADVEAGRSVAVDTLHEALRGDVRRPLLLLAAAAGLLLVIAVVNVAGLVLGRRAERRDEVVLRRALGARPGDLLRTFLAETSILGLAGGLGGAAVAAVAARALPALLTVAGAPGGGLPPGVEIPGLQPAVLLAALGGGGGVALLLAAVTALTPGHARRLAGAAPEADRIRGSGPVGGSPQRRLLVVAQLAVSLVLVLSAGLLLRSLDHLLRTDPGFSADGVWRFGIGLPEARYGTEESMIDFHRRLRGALEELPGVESAGLVAALPVGGRGFTTRHQPAGAGRPAPEWDRAAVNVVSPGYFETLEIPVRAGRSFVPADTPEARRVAMVSVSFRDRFPDGGAVGDVLELSWRSALNPPGTRWQIVGVVGDVRHAGLERPPEPTVYLSTGQFPLDGGSYVLRAPGSDSLAARVAATVRRLDPDLQQVELGSVAQRVRDSLGDRRLALTVLGLFAAAALGLTAIGVYGVVALESVRRRRELAIRKALGARARHVVALVLRNGLTLGIAGAGIGWLGFLAVGGLLAHRLHGITPSDATTTLAAAGILVGVALLASLAPSIRAARAAPMSTIREG